MEGKRTIKKRDIIQGLRGGLINLQIMEKYQLSLKRLKSILTVLLDSETITDSELEGRVPQGDNTVDVDPQRTFRRNYLFVNLPVCEADHGSEDGYVRDITEKGLQIAGLPATVGGGKALVLKPDSFTDIGAFVLEARCKWVKPATDEEESLAGFEITDISKQHIGELRNVIQTLTLGS